MKRISILVMSLLVLFSCSAFAASIHASKIGVVILGSSDFKTNDYFNSIKSSFPSNNNYTVEYGSTIQSKYQNFWLNKGFLEEQKPVKQDLIDFVKNSGYGKVLFIMVNNPVVDTHQTPVNLFNTVVSSRASVSINAFVVDNENIIKVASSTKEDDSQTSELRAKRGAFRKCLQEISTSIDLSK